MFLSYFELFELNLFFLGREALSYNWFSLSFLIGWNFITKCKYGFSKFIYTVCIPFKKRFMFIEWLTSWVLAKMDLNRIAGWLNKHDPKKEDEFESLILEESEHRRRVHLALICFSKRLERRFWMNYVRIGLTTFGVCVGMSQLYHFLRMHFGWHHQLLRVHIGFSSESSQ